jgi:hypothetical protein
MLVLPRLLLHCYRLAGWVAVTTVVAGCNSIGPHSIRANRTDYNLAIQATNDQELLLNLVRSHYRDNMYFTTVEHVVSSEELLRSASANLGVGWTGNTPYSKANAASSVLRRSATQSLELGPAGITEYDQPTIFYAPVEGEKFVRQMMTPMNMQTLILLIRSGWSVDRVLTVAAQSMNGLPNAPSASGPSPASEPQFGDFREATRLMRELQSRGDFEIAHDASGKHAVFHFLHGSAKSPDAMQLKQRLHLSPDIDSMVLADDQPMDGHTLVLTTRPLMAAINYLSEAVQDAQDDVSSGRVKPTLADDGRTPFDWQQLFDGLFVVHVGKEQPQDADVTVHYRNHWYYIADNDLESKATFVLLTQLIALHSVPPKQGPVLSYSVP